MQLAQVLLNIPPSKRTARQWHQLGRNHGLACVARVERDGQLDPQDRRCYMLAVIEGQRVAGQSVLHTAEWNYYLGYIESLGFEIDLSGCESEWTGVFKRRAIA